jgi:hypothetical protein
VVDRRTALAGGALLLAGCGSGGTLRARVKNGAKVSPADIAILNRLLEVEYYAIAAYTAGIPFLPHDQKKVAKQFLGQDVAHASTLAGLIKQGGGKAVRQQASYDLGEPTAPEILNLLHRLEAKQDHGQRRAASFGAAHGARSAAGSLGASERQGVTRAGGRSQNQAGARRLHGRRGRRGGLDRS